MRPLGPLTGEPAAGRYDGRAPARSGPRGAAGGRRTRRAEAVGRASNNWTRPDSQPSDKTSAHDGDKPADSNNCRYRRARPSALTASRLHLQPTILHLPYRATAPAGSSGTAVRRARAQAEPAAPARVPADAHGGPVRPSARASSAAAARATASATGAAERDESASNKQMAAQSGRGGRKMSSRSTAGPTGGSGDAGLTAELAFHGFPERLQSATSAGIC